MNSWCKALGFYSRPNIFNFLGVAEFEQSGAPSRTLETQWRQKQQLLSCGVDIDQICIFNLCVNGNQKKKKSVFTLLTFINNRSLSQLIFSSSVVPWRGVSENWKAFCNCPSPSICENRIDWCKLLKWRLLIIVIVY